LSPGSTNTQLSYPREVFARWAPIQNAPDPIRDAHLDILEVVFFASMMLEEGETVPIGVVIDHDGRLEDVLERDSGQAGREPERAWFVVRFAPIDLSPASLKRVARGTAYGRDLVVVQKRNERLIISGLARRRERTDGGDALRIAAPRPGVLILETFGEQMYRYDVGRTSPVATNVFLWDGPVRTALEACGFDKDQRWILAETLRNARASNRGAIFICLPDALPEELRSEVRYRFAQPEMISTLARLHRSQILQRVASARPEGGNITAEEVGEGVDSAREEERIGADLAAAGEILAQLSAIDGAIVIERGFNVLGAGFIIPTGSGSLPQTRHCFDALASKSEIRPIGGGARHAAGLRFAWDYPGSVVFVVSSAGPVTCILRRGEEALTWHVRIWQT